MKLDNIQYEQILHTVDDGVYIVDTERNILFWSDGAETVSGFSSEDVVGHFCHENILQHVNERGTELCTGDCPLVIAMREKKSRVEEVFLHHKDGHRVPVEVKVTPLRGERGEIIGAAEVFTDLSPSGLAAEKMSALKKLAMLDHITQLPNRQFVELRMNSLFAETRNSGQSLGIIIIEVDNFKKVNDQFGEEIGDSILRVIAKTLVASSKHLDIIGRWAGVRFVGMTTGISEEKLFAVASRIRVLIENTIVKIEPRRPRVTVSIGATMSTSSDTFKSFLKRGEQLLAISQKSGKNRVTISSKNLVM